MVSGNVTRNPAEAAIAVEDPKIQTVLSLRTGIEHDSRCLIGGTVMIAWSAGCTTPSAKGGHPLHEVWHGWGKRAMGSVRASLAVAMVAASGSGDGMLPCLSEGGRLDRRRGGRRRRQGGRPR